MTTAMHEGIGVAAAWRLLSLGFAPPTAELLDEIESLAVVLYDVDEAPELEDLLVAVRSTDVESVSAQHASLFRGKVLVAPYEGSYELDPIRQGRQMADVAAFYLAFGAEAHGPAAERPDFVGCELEFLSFLELRRLAALEADEVATAAEHGYYRSLADFGASLLEAELSRLELTPTPLSRRRPGASADASTFECGAVS
jgi:nitrate reductase assembly molybdenum cofactor insertion protein NarJ